MLLAQSNVARKPSDNNGVAGGLARRDQLAAVVALPFRAVVDCYRICAVGLEGEALDLFELVADEPMDERALHVEGSPEIIGRALRGQIKLHGYHARLAIRVRLDAVVLVIP